MNQLLQTGHGSFEPLADEADGCRLQSQRRRQKLLRQLKLQHALEAPATMSTPLGADPVRHPEGWTD